MRLTPFIAAALMFLAISVCHADTLVLDNRSLRPYTPPAPSADTKLVSLKGEAQQPTAMDKEDICGGSKRHICSHVGLVAHVIETDIAIGKITGVAWKPKGATLGRALDADGLIMANFMVQRDAFYYIVYSPTEGVILVECSSALAR